jgi:hypothetical protein
VEPLPDTPTMTATQSKFRLCLGHRLTN